MFFRICRGTMARHMVIVLLGALPWEGIALAGAIEFNRDVRPILSENCFQCHGPDKGRRKAKLRLDERDSAIGLKAIVPGKPGESALVARITSQEESELMPPPQSHKKLTAIQKETLKRWIEEGAEYQPHWAFLAPKRATPPLVKNRAWVRNPIDAFLLAALEEKGVAPSPEADRRTLLRRLSLDLLGLPPEPEKVRSFVADEDPMAYDRFVEELLKSHHFGERMAVPWLDLARFSDTVGYHGDQNHNAFPYRDYVIASFNNNKRFDEFTREQLAGDLLLNPTPEQLVATAFNRLNMVTREGGAQPKEYLAKYAADRVRTVSGTWLGATMGCCECHDHKYDPFTARDFYSLAAFFADVRQWGVYQNYAYTPNPDLKGFSNDHPFPPEIEVVSPYLQRRQVVLRDRMRQLGAEATFDDKLTAAFSTWQAFARGYLSKHANGWVAHPAALNSKPKTGLDAQPQSDGSALLIGKTAKSAEQTFVLRPSPGWIAAVRLELLPHSRHQGKVTRDGSDTTSIQLSVTHRLGQGGKQIKLGVFFGEADARQQRYANGFAGLGIQAAGWRTLPERKSERQVAYWLLDRPIQIAAEDQLAVSLTSDNVGCIRLATSPFVGEDPLRPDLAIELRAALECERRNKDQEALVRTEFIRGAGAAETALRKIRSTQMEYLECRGGKTPCLVTEAWPPRVTRVLPRGNWQDETGAAVTPAVPAFLTSRANATESRRLTRLDLANWLVSPENPLTARVFVNRLWKQFFGTGISAVMEDLGAQGEPPVHPALLDWLAVEFRESGWDVKHMVRLILQSSAYRQDSRARPELKELDPANRLVAFQSPRRLEAEFVRDNALAISGLLNLDMGGPGVKPYQPLGYYANLQFPNRVYTADKDDRQYRRGVYTHWQRTFLHPMLANFDAPSREECTACRTAANTPQQALTLLNDPTFVESARALAERVSMWAASDGERLDRLFELALARAPKAAERAALLSFLDAQRKFFQGNPEEARKLIRVGLRAPAEGDAVEPAAWASVCRVVLNLHETITRY